MSSPVRRGRQAIPRPVEWRPGPSPPWSSSTLPPTADALAATAPPAGRPLAPAFPGARPSAVLIALADGDRGPEVLLTRRSMELSHHKGEISFPGGRMDPGETPLDAALREAHEEVGLEPDVVAPRGELTHLNTIVSRSYIVPVVATVGEPVELAPASPEVDRVLWVPIATLADPDRYRSERWGRPPTDRLIHFFELDDETVWGATAHLLTALFTTTPPQPRF
ncbi:MAG: CoA pyrophosphatase [Ilumatobacteraceae bacterium]